MPESAVADARFWNAVAQVGECWLWTLSIGGHGYGQVRRSGWTYLAHRVAYAATFGDLEGRIHLHHTCEVKRCVNPAHLQQETPHTHMSHHGRRLPLCKWGHSLTNPDNVRLRKDGARICRTCERRRLREWAARNP